MTKMKAENGVFIEKYLLVGVMILNKLAKDSILLQSKNDNSKAYLTQENVSRILFG